MARLTSLTVNDTGNLALPIGTQANRDTINTTVVNFTSVASTTWTVPANVNSVEVLVVAGGGGGGRYGGGGGAGGLIYNPAYIVTPGQVITVTVGAGGAGHPGDAQSGGSAASGGNSRFGDLIAFGGGGGGNYNQSGATGAQVGGAGGSGGGTGGNGTVNALRTIEQQQGGAAVLGQGNRGGMQSTGYAAGTGGGGGAGAGGEDGPPGGPSGRGGVGLEFDISGTPTYYAGGGGGGGMNGYTAALSIPGGKGGGGYGLAPSFSGSTSIIDGTANTGGGGGGGSDNSIGSPAVSRAGNGGSGIVIVRYALTPALDRPSGQTRFNTATKSLEQYLGTNRWSSAIFAGENIVRNGLCLYYDAKAYSGTGTTWLDLSGRNYHGTINGSPTYSTTEGAYFNLDGTDDHISVPAAAWPSGREHTVEVWVKGAATRSSSIVEARDSAGNRAFNAHLTWSNGRVYYDSGVLANDRIERDVPNGEYYGWHHWVFTKDAEAPNKGSSTRGNMTIYRDGKLYHTGGGNNATNAAAIINIGAYALASPTTFHQGPVSQVRFYNRALGADEVKRNYDATRSRYGRMAPALTGLRGSPGSSPETAAPNARYIKELTGTTQNGFYWLKPGNQEPIWVYCDMNYDGGGWSLVMCNARAGQVTGIGGTNGIGNLTYYQSINHVWYNGNPDYGTYGSGATNLAGSHRLKFRCLVGLKYWPSLGLNIAQFCSTDAVSLNQTASHTKRYRWSYTGFSSTYAFQGAAAVGDDGSGAGSPGMYSYHAANGYQWSTGDNGNPSNTCPSSYGNTPFWYGGCWSGNMYGGGNSGSYQDGPFWDGSGSDYHNYMSVYLKANPQ